MTDKRRTAGQHPVLRVDWTAIHRRLESVAAIVEQRVTPGAGEAQRVLRERAKTLARAPQREQPGERLEVLEFLLAHERYAVDSSFVREVCPLRELTSLPGTPAFVLGVVNIRGQIVSVVNLKTFFDLPERGLTDFNKIVILTDGAMEFGVLVDAVVDVHRIALPDIQPPLPTLTGIRQHYLRGVTAQRLVILDAARILADPAMVVQEGAKS